jgi:predicted RNA-binding protein with PIN domain
MSIIVDGYNYIGRSQELHLSDPTARDKAIYLMGQYCAKAKKTLTLVFDGNHFAHHVNRKRRYGRITVIYTSPIYTADETIKKMVKKQNPRRRKSMLVVSSDTEILEYAKSHGTTVAKSEEFERLLHQTLATPKGLDRVNIQISDEEVQNWLKIFGSELSETKKISHHSISKTSPRSSFEISQSDKQPGNQEKPSKHTIHTKKNTRSKSPLSSPKETIDRVHVHLSSQEVQEWMAIFGAEPESDE